MGDILVKSTGFALHLLEEIFKDKVTVSGVENIPQDNPIMFAVNHFTRAETLIMPYIIHKHTGKVARSLADKALFKGKLGEYLTNTGTLATDNPQRDEIIVGDLLSGESNWIIYPEGNMMKNKKITSEKGKFFLHLKDKTRSLFTGSASLAIKSQLLRDDLLKYDDKMTKWKYQIHNDRAVTAKPTTIIPVNITYYPIRPGENKAMHYAEKFAGRLSTRLAEELEIEGNILAEANMHIHFGKPIFVDDFIAIPRAIATHIPLISKEKKHDLIINYFRHKLTTKFMGEVYKNVCINLDHIFALTLYYSNKTEFHIDDLISEVYLNLKGIQQLENYRLHDSLKMDVFKVLAGKTFPPLKSIMDLAVKEGILVGNDEYEYWSLNREAFDNEYDFHTIRQKNILKILVNEVSLLDEVISVVKENSTRKNEGINQEIFDLLYKKDVDNYDKDYKKYFDKEFSKSFEIGKPFFLKAPNSRIGIVLSHGYKAAPEEIRPLAEFLHKQGFNIYAVRLHGHGTAPINLKNTAWQKWYDSYMRGVVALDQVCDKIFFAGFSTGGLMSLYTAAQQTDKCYGVISINAAVKLHDIRVRLVKMVNFWNELSDKVRGKGVMDYIDDEPEYPEINYSRNYIKGVNELGKLMKSVVANLEKIHAPTLIMQSKFDPIVKAESGKFIFDAIKSKNKMLIEPDLKKHVIVRGDVEKEVYLPILNFINTLCKR